MTSPAFLIKRKQYLLAGIAALIVLILIGVLILSIESEVKPSEPAPSHETNIATAGSRMNSQEMWVERMESEQKITQQKLDALETVLTTGIKSTAESEVRINQRLDEIEEKRETLPSLNAPMGQEFPNAPGEGQAFSSGIRKIILKLSPQSLGPSAQGHLNNVKGSERSTLENTLPAGSFAKAILLGGVDASTAITSPSDPRPVLLRITDHGNLPRKFKSDLKDCHILASSYGDLSSERVYMRLEKLTCTERLTGEISETQVAGYIVGEDGRAGIRGLVADKAGPLIRNSLVGGFLSGMGQFFGAQQQRAVFPVSPLGQTNALSSQQMFTSGAASGASNALEKYADFFIKRAEQLQPVLQVAAGREVDIVFTQGTKFGETSVRASLSKIRNHSRKTALQKLESQSDSQDWLPESEDTNDQQNSQPYGDDL